MNLMHFLVEVSVARNLSFRRSVEKPAKLGGGGDNKRVIFLLYIIISN